MTAMLGLIASVFQVSFNGDAQVRIDASRRTLPKLLNAAGLSKGAEIGVWEGSFAEHLCKHTRRLDLLCVDPWAVDDEYHEVKNDRGRLEAAYASAKQRLQRFGCTLCRKSSMEAAKLVPYRSLDFVYIDANHRRSFVLEDLAEWSRRVRVGGIVAGHDYKDYANKPFIEVKAAVDDFTRAHGIAPLFVLGADKSPSFFWVVA